MKYDASVRALLQPGRAPALFQTGQEYGPAGLCAEFSRLAYRGFEHSPAIAAQLTGEIAIAGFSVVALLAQAGTQVMVLQRQQTLVLVFRGTLVQQDNGRLDWTDLRTDAGFWQRGWQTQEAELRLAQVLLGEGDARVHAGFAKALDVIWPQLAAWVEQCRPEQIWLTGHSLGAALAILAAGGK